MASGRRFSGTGRQLATGLAVTLGLSLGAFPNELRAQATEVTAVTQATADERSHLVKPGDTLWELAEQYLGDGLLWRAIARRNDIAVTSASIVPIKVGQMLVIPPKGATVDVRAGAADGELAVPQMALAPALRDTATSGILQIDQLLAERARRRAKLVADADYAAAKDSMEVQTVFYRELPTVEAAERAAGILTAGRAPSPRRAEFESAPFEAGREAMEGAGKLVRRLGTMEDGRIVRTDRVEVEVPPQRAYATGDRLIVFRIADGGSRSSQVAVPTGVLEVVGVVMGSSRVHAVVRSQTGTIEIGQRVMAAVGDPADRAVAVRLASPDLETTVTWLDQTEAIPTLQSFLMLGVGAQQGARAGDEFALYAKGPENREQLLATVRVVRTGTVTSAALLTRQYASGVKLGVVARRFAKAP